MTPQNNNGFTNTEAAIILLAFFFVASVFAFFATSMFFSDDTSAPIIPPGCAVVDNLDTCYSESHTRLVSTGKVTIPQSYTDTHCQQVLTCYNGSIWGWPQ